MTWGKLSSMVVPVVLLAGCAEEASSPSIEPAESSQAIDIVAAHFAGSDDPNGTHFTDAEARCAAEHVVGSIGLERLAELGLAVDTGTPPELSEPPLDDEEGDAVYAAIDECIDLEGQMVHLLTGGDVSPDEARCVARHYLATDLPRRALLSTYDPGLNADIDAAMNEAGSECGVA